MARGPFLGRLIRSYYHSLYETAAIEGALKEAFTESADLFGAKPTSSGMYGIKVAVTATAVSSSVVLSNYNRISGTSRKCLWDRSMSRFLTVLRILPFRASRKRMCRVAALGSVGSLADFLCSF